MPVSKKPRRAKAKPRAQAPVLPDRRVMESLLSAIHGRSGDAAISGAQTIMYDAWEQTSPAARIARARKALKVSPLCADAYALLAEESAKSLPEARDLFAKGVEAGELAIGPEKFEEYRGHFWGFMETRPYMRARAGLANVLAKLGETPAAIGHYRDMLTLNPGDNQGIRYELLALLMQSDDPVPVNALLDEYPNDWSPYWLYTRLLLAFRAGEQEEPRVADWIKDAVSQNAHVPGMLSGATRPAALNGEYITVGGADEATHYVVQCGVAWQRTPGAVAWLASAVAALPPQPAKHG
jgi:tetratricopeptide (TPR) repeat protein